MARWISDTFWGEDLWLPADTTWRDVTNGPDKTVVYTEISDFVVTVPIAVIISVVRHILENYYFPRLGKSLGVKSVKSSVAPHNPKLEAAYVKSPKRIDVCSIAKQLEMTERQVERWWRLRRNQDKPSTLVKFRETCWKATFHFYSFCHGLILVWNKEWAWDIQKCFVGYPHHGVSADVRWFIMIQSAYAWYDFSSQMSGVRRKDFWQLFVHHIATIVLLCCCWICNLHRIIVVVLLVHDSADIPLQAAKVTKYAKYHRVCNCLFLVFTFVWILSRLMIYPYLIEITLTQLPNLPVLIMLKTLMCLLLILHIMWTWYIAQIAYKLVFVGEIKRDARSSESEMSGNSHEE